jgi:hypothetical protein
MKKFLALTALAASLFVGSASATIVTLTQTQDPGPKNLIPVSSLSFNSFSYYGKTEPLLSVEIILGNSQ